MSRFHLTPQNSWCALLTQTDFIPGSTNDLITSQFTAFQAGEVPTIVASCITTIPITECHEPLIDIRAQDTTRIQMETGSNTDLPAASKVRRSLLSCLQSMVKILDAYAPYFGYESGKIAISVSEGLRGLETQKKLFNAKLQEIENNPDLNLKGKAAIKETSKWVSPLEDNIPVHSTGGAIDMRLYECMSNTLLDMGKWGVMGGPNEEAPTFYENLTESQKKNRLLLLITATQAGLINYPYEWWHYSYGDRYAAYWLTREPEKRKAIYGPI